MAFGFKRLPGTARTYLNESNPDLPIGTVLSRDQYDKFVIRLGKHNYKPGIEAINEASRNIEETADKLREIAKLQGLNADLQAQLTHAEGELARTNRLLRGREKTDAGQRLLNITLDLYVDEQRAQGRNITKQQARKSTEFKEILSALKPKANKKRNPREKARDMAAKRRAFQKLGGSDNFREKYERRYGIRGTRSRNRQSSGRTASGMRIKRRLR